MYKKYYLALTLGASLVPAISTCNNTHSSPKGAPRQATDATRAQIKQMVATRAQTNNLTDAQQASMIAFMEAEATGDIAEIARAIDQGAAFFFAYVKEEGTLLWALMNEHFDIAKTVISKKPELINAHGPQGITPLIVAAVRGYTEIVKLLITHGANIHARSSEGQTALTYAAIISNSDAKETKDAQPIDRSAIVRALILAGADSSALNKPKLPSAMQTIIATAQQEYAQHVHTKLETVIENVNSLSGQEKATFNPILLNAVIQGDRKTVIIILKHGIVDIETSDVNGNTLLLLAIENKREAIAIDLLGLKANVNAKSDDNGQTPLIKACIVNSPKIVSALLAHNANVNAQDKDGLTPLLWAAFNTNDTAVMELLLNLDGKRTHKVSLELGPRKGFTPLMVAAISENTEAIKLLIKAGADANVINTAEAYLKEKVDPSIRKLITKLHQEKTSTFARIKNSIANMFASKK